MGRARPMKCKKTRSFLLPGGRASAGEAAPSLERRFFSSLSRERAGRPLAERWAEDPEKDTREESTDARRRRTFLALGLEPASEYTLRKPRRGYASLFGLVSGEPREVFSRQRRSARRRTRAEGKSRRSWRPTNARRRRRQMPHRKGPAALLRVTKSAIFPGSTKEDTWPGRRLPSCCRKAHALPISRKSSAREPGKRRQVPSLEKPEPSL